MQIYGSKLAYSSISSEELSNAFWNQRRLHIISSILWPTSSSLCQLCTAVSSTPVVDFPLVKPYCLFERKDRSFRCKYVFAGALRGWWVAILIELHSMHLFIVIMFCVSNCSWYSVLAGWPLVHVLMGQYMQLEHSLYWYSTVCEPLWISYTHYSKPKHFRS